MFIRYALEGISDLLLEDLDILPPDLPPRYNISPPQKCPVIVREYRESTNIQGFQWGLLPHWAENEREGLKAVNAEVESLTSDRRFADAFGLRRCLVPATGFYQWQREKGGKKKTPYYFTSESFATPLVFAGLWERWGSPANRIRSCTIITTSANKTLSPFTNHMPVVVNREDWLAWLDPENNDVDILLQILGRSSGMNLKHWQVSSYVNSATHEGKRCILPIQDAKGL